MSSKGKIAITCALLVCVAAVLWMTTTSQRSLTTYTYSQFLDQVHSGKIASVVVIVSNSGAVEATCQMKDGKTARTVLPSDYKDALQAMQAKLVNVEIRDSLSEPLRFFMNAIPFLLLLVAWAVLMLRKSPNSFKQAFLS
jgi:ATP-dependent Zn protease